MYFKIKTFYMKNLSLAICLFFISQLINAQVAPAPELLRPLLVGSKVPNTEVILNGESIKTDEIFKNKPTVLVVYRGGWCPYCNNQLNGLVKVEDALIKEEYQIIAVSPDSKSGKNQYSKKYKLASDSNTTLIQGLGIAYRAPKNYGSILEKASKGKNKNVIPAPAVYIIDKKGKIMFEHININYKVRLDENILLSIAKSIKA